jgi:hypothetical protein
MESKLTKIATGAELAARIKKIGTDLLELAADLVHAIDAKPEIINEMVEAGTNPELIRRLEALGRGQIDQRLVFATGRAHLKLMRCPLSEQKKVLEVGLEVLQPDLKDTRLIQLAELSDSQRKQVFARDHVRTSSEQRTWLEERGSAPNVVAIGKKPYRVMKGKIWFTDGGRGYTLTVQQLSLLLAEAAA